VIKLVLNWFSALTSLKCTKCNKVLSPEGIQTVCPECGGVLYAQYDLEAVKERISWEALSRRPRSMGLWRYYELLPVRRYENVVSLGEGATPLLKVSNLGRYLGLRNLYLKDESLNPTGTFKARGVAVAVSRARELGIKKIGMPSAGNAGAALAAYSARAGLKAYIYAPKDTPVTMITEIKAYGAQLKLVEGTISEAALELSKVKSKEGIFDLTTMKEPYRVEGKKTMGFEIVEGLREIPDVIIYPTGGGTGLLGIWKGINELQALGLIGDKKPRMISVQSEGCAPIVEAFRRGWNAVIPPKHPSTIATGLRVPKPYADYLILKVIRESRGLALAVSDNEIIRAIKDLARYEGILACPEGAATIAGLKKLLADGEIGRDDLVVVINTGSGLKYMDQLRRFLI